MDIVPLTQNPEETNDQEVKSYTCSNWTHPYTVDPVGTVLFEIPTIRVSEGRRKLTVEVGKDALTALSKMMELPPGPDLSTVQVSGGANAAAGSATLPATLPAKAGKRKQGTSSAPKTSAPAAKRCKANEPCHEGFNENSFKMTPAGSAAIMDHLRFARRQFDLTYHVRLVDDDGCVMVDKVVCIWLYVFACV